MASIRRAAAWTLGAAVLAGLALLLVLPRVPTLVLRDGRGAVVARIPCEGGGFVHRYVHSVHLSEVDEEYSIERNGILHLTASRFDTLGVGIPYDEECGFSLLDGRFELRMDRRYPSLPVRVSPLSGHAILTGGREYPLTDWFAPGDLVVLTARRLPRLPAFPASAGGGKTR